MQSIQNRMFCLHPRPSFRLSLAGDNASAVAQRSRRPLRFAASLATRIKADMVQGEQNGRHRTIALFDVDGTLTVPRKVRPTIARHQA